MHTTAIATASWSRSLGVMEYRKDIRCSGTYPHPQLAQNIVNSQHVLTRIARRNRDPFIAALYMASEDERRRRRSGGVKMKLTLDEWQLRRGAKGGEKPG